MIREQSESTRFVLYDFAGREKSYYKVDKIVLKEPPAGDSSAKKRVAVHHIIVVDRSGSMYGEIEPLKDTLIKVLTLDEYLNPELKITLISYSSEFDCTVHFRAVPVSEVMGFRSKYVDEIKKIRATCLTCISQGLDLAVQLADPNEVTAITLHSDGYANDSSPRAEADKLKKICESVAKTKPQVFINTIAYSPYCDFKLLSGIANSASGSCIRADQSSNVYDAIYGTSQKLSELAGPLYEEALGDYDYHVFVSRSAERINGSSADLRVGGVREHDDKTIYKYKQLSKSEYEALTIPVVQTSEAIFVLAKSLLADGQLNTAKFAVLSSFDTTLSGKHMRALTNNEIAEFTTDLTKTILSTEEFASHRVTPTLEISNKISVLMLLRLLGKYREGFLVDYDHLLANYTRRGLKRVQGVRDDQGVLQEPWLKTKDAETDRMVRVSSFDLNRNTATINMLISRRVNLVRRDNEEVIENVAGVSLSDLRTFNNYTLVGDGEINVKSLKIQISSQDLFERLQQHEVLLTEDGKAAETFSESANYLIPLSELPLVPFSGRFESTDGVFEQLATLKTISSILSAHLKEASDVFTAEQVEELKKHYLSKSLFLNFPTTTEYTDLQEALANGSVDYRVSYKIDIGSQEILNLGELKSANAFLDRMYEAYDVASGDALKDKPKFEMCLDGKVYFRAKKLSARTKITAVDNFQKPIFDEFLSYNASPQSELGKYLRLAGASMLVDLMAEKAAKQAVSREEWIGALTDASKKLGRYADEIFEEKVCPLVFYIGATGLLPDEFSVNALTAEDMQAKFPELKIGKDEKEGLFFLLGKSLIVVYSSNELFSRTPVTK